MQCLRKRRFQYYNRFSREEMKVKVASDNRILTFEYYVISQDESVARKLHFFRQINSVGQIGTIEGSRFISGLTHFRHRIECRLKLGSPLIPKQLIGIKRYSLIEQQLASGSECLAANLKSFFLFLSNLV